MGSEAAISGPGWRAWAEEKLADGFDLMRVWKQLETDVLAGQPVFDRDGNQIGRKPDAALYSLWARLRLGRNGTMPLPILCKLDRELLESVEGCLEGVMLVAEAEMSGAITADQADAMRKTIDLALRAHNAQKGERLMDVLMEGGARPIYTEATMSPEEAGAYVAEQMRAREENDGE